MAVRAEQPEVLGPVVERVAIDVVHLEAEWPALPYLADPAYGARCRDPGRVQRSSENDSRRTARTCGPPNQHRPHISLRTSVGRPCRLASKVRYVQALGVDESKHSPAIRLCRGKSDFPQYFSHRLRGADRLANGGRVQLQPPIARRPFDALQPQLTDEAVTLPGSHRTAKAPEYLVQALSAIHRLAKLICREERLLGRHVRIELLAEVRYVKAGLLDASADVGVCTSAARNAQGVENLVDRVACRDGGRQRLGRIPRPGRSAEVSRIDPQPIEFFAYGGTPPARVLQAQQ